MKFRVYEKRRDKTAGRLDSGRHGRHVALFASSCFSSSGPADTEAAAVVVLPAVAWGGCGGEGRPWLFADAAALSGWEGRRNAAEGVVVALLE